MIYRCTIGRGHALLARYSECMKNETCPPFETFLIPGNRPYISSNWPRHTLPYVVRTRAPWLRTGERYENRSRRSWNRQHKTTERQRNLLRLDERKNTSNIYLPERSRCGAPIARDSETARKSGRLASLWISGKKKKNSDHPLARLNDACRGDLPYLSSCFVHKNTSRKSKGEGERAADAGNKEPLCAYTRARGSLYACIRTCMYVCMLT